MTVLRLASVLVLSTVLSVFGGTAAAVAQTPPSAAPPGNSAVDQYRESLPPSSSKTRKLSDRDRAALERRGSDGAALAAVLDRTGGVPRSGAASGSSGAASGSSGAASGSSGADRGKRERSESGARNGAGPATRSAADPTPDAVDSRPIAPAAASSTVGPVPVWAMLVAALALVGVGLLVRVRTTP